MTAALILMGGMGLVISVILALASKIFYVYVDPKIEAVEAELPGANCGGCGLPGCAANAEAIVAGTSPPNSCVAAGPEVAEAIAAIMGVKIEAQEPDIARPGCYYGVQAADTKYTYDGLDDCRAAVLLGGGMKVCTIGCVGLGTCARACPFNAITMGPEGLPVVDEAKCTGCGTCERVCPKHIITLSSVTRRIMREYTTEECTTPCQRACPAGIDIREYIRQISLGNYHNAVQVIKERNPFPAIIGRICPRPCELDCRRNYIDEPVAINFLKRYAADYERQSGKRVLPYKAPETDHRIAVVGGGVEGLSAAFFAARLGHQVTVFEATPTLGGLLRSAIAKERLPEEILTWDIEGILEMGVKAENGKVLGRDFTVATLLRQGFETVFLATGGWDSRLARGIVIEEHLPIAGSYLMVDWLNLADKDNAADFCPTDVVIYGGGRLALKTARTCRDRGAQRVTILLRENRSEAGFSDVDLDDAGLQVIYNAGLQRLVGQDDSLERIEYVDLHSRKKTSVSAQGLIIAAGRFPELIFTASKIDAPEIGESSDQPLKWEATAPYKQPVLGNEIGLFAEGDVLADYSAAIKAIGAGRRAAASLHQVIHGLEPALSGHVIMTDADVQNVDHVENVAATARRIMPICSGPELAVCGEIERGFTEDMARAEADRCLQCGLICYEHSEASPVKEESTA
jgi:NADPH-dependent glutamate synthase beta subunit-like oxidoreductase